MAIDDNADYTLTGAQVKDLAQRVQSGGGASYTAGNGIDITNNEISIDDTVVAEVSDIPTKTSDLTNDGADGSSTYVEADDLATVATSGSYTDLTNQPTIPAAQVQSDWSQSTSTAVDYIKNKPGIKNATAATHTDYNNNQDYLPNMRFLSFWNGAYNSSGNSNLSYLANNAVKTANINDSAVTKVKMHGLPCPDYGNTITNWGTISSTSTKTTTADGFVVGKAIVTGAEKQAYVDIGGLQVAGIPYTSTNLSNFQVAFCIPVKSGTSVKFTCSSGGSFQGCRLLGWQM